MRVNNQQMSYPLMVKRGLANAVRLPACSIKPGCVMLDQIGQQVY
jgi:hypothetical protein